MYYQNSSIYYVHRKYQIIIIPLFGIQQWDLYYIAICEWKIVYYIMYIFSHPNKYVRIMCFGYFSFIKTIFFVAFITKFILLIKKQDSSVPKAVMPYLFIKSQSFFPYEWATCTWNSA